MSYRKLIGAVAFGLLLLVGVVIRYVAGISQEDWDPVWALAYTIGLCVAFILAFYDRKNFPEKTWDYNPRRGVMYFFLGWIILPISIGVDAMFGANITLSSMIIGTFFISSLIGLLGTFTANVGV